jgi:hypothetical protein
MRQLHIDQPQYVALECWQRGWIRRLLRLRLLQSLDCACLGVSFWCQLSGSLRATVAHTSD